MGESIAEKHIILAEQHASYLSAIVHTRCKLYVQVTVGKMQGNAGLQSWSVTDSKRLFESCNRASEQNKWKIIITGQGLDRLKWWERKQESAWWWCMNGWIRWFSSTSSIIVKKSSSIPYHSGPCSGKTAVLTPVFKQKSTTRKSSFISSNHLGPPIYWMFKNIHKCFLMF